MNDLQDESISRRQPEHGSVFFTGLAHWISALGFAPVLSIPAFATIVLTGGSGRYGVTAELFVSILFGFLFPSIAMYSFVKIRGISYDNRESRLLPLLSVAAVYFTGVFAVYEISVPVNAIVLMFCYGTNTLMIYLISLKWKISVHAMGVAGPATALVFALGGIGGLLGLIMLPVVWSRLYMGKHTSSQVAVGGLLGYFLTGAQFLLIGILVFHSDINTSAVMLLIVVLAFPFLTFSFYNSAQFFRFSTIILLLSSLLMGYLFMVFNMVEADFLLASNLALFMAMLALPSSENSGIRIVHNIRWKEHAN